MRTEVLIFNSNHVYSRLRGLALLQELQFAPFPSPFLVTVCSTWWDVELRIGKVAQED